MFKPAHDPLQAYLAERAAVANAGAAASSGDGSGKGKLWRWLSQHGLLLHKLWVYGVALAVTCSVINPLAGWKEFLVVPIVTLFMGPVVMLAELPFSVALVFLWSLVSECVKWRQK
jgi:hypothetical protein